ncbi:MAG: hypothetical protein E7040_00725 [Lentisphaerae bacterium]|nr:hypothetical protein [Lentisphaerota bacterium]
MFRHTRFFYPMKKLFCIIFLLLILPILYAKPRIVSLTPALTETICFLGGESMLVARSAACDYPRHIMKLPAAGDYRGFYIEKLLMMKPDYIVTNGIPMKSVRQKKYLKAKVIDIPATTLNDYIQSLITLGDILGCPERGKKEAAKAAKRVNELKQEAAKIRKKPTALWVIWHNPILLAGPGSLPNSIMELAGLENLAANAKASYFRCSREWMVMQKPDYLIWTPGFSFRRNGIWKVFSEKQIISGLNSDTLLRPGPRVFEGIDQLKKAIESAQKSY